MNYLAHLFLSANIEGLIIGNFIGDSVKGDDYLDYPEPIKNGIILHRKIDNFTDHHSIIHDAKHYFKPEFDKYSGVLIDVYFDHFLAKNFYKFSQISLADFEINIQILLKNNFMYLNSKSKLFYEYMLKHDILSANTQLSAIEKVLNGITHRIEHRSELVKSITIFNDNYDALEQLFFVFWNEISEYIRVEIDKLNLNAI